MPDFEYTLRNAQGSLIKGTLNSADRKQALIDLKRKGLMPIKLVEASGTSAKKPSIITQFSTRIWGGLNKAQTQAQDSSGYVSGSGAKDTAKIGGATTSKGELAGLNLLKRLYELHKSGLPIGDAIRILQNRLSDPGQKALAISIWRDLSEGIPLAKALSRRSTYFPTSACHVIQAGEATGQLAPVLKKVIDYLEQKRAIRKKMLSSMAYPSFVTAVAVLVAILFLTVLLPQIEGMLDRLGGEMTWSARLLIDGSNLLIQFGPFLVMGLIFTLVGLGNWKTKPKGRAFLDKLSLKMPLFGKIIYYSSLYQTGNLVATLLQSGINTTETLQLTEKTIENTALKTQFTKAKEQINEGVSITQAFRVQNFMPDIALDILAVGEDTGNLATSMEEITEGFKEELSRRLNHLTTLVSALALGFAFSLVTLIAIGIVTSVFQVSKTLSI